MHRIGFRPHETIGALMQGQEILQSRGSLDVPVLGISCHSDQVESGHLFVAIAGARQDGHQFVRKAMERGAVGSIVEHVLEGLPRSFVQVQVCNTREALAEVAAKYYGQPARQLNLIGITGTNGKTTTSALLEGILRAGGCRVGILGTIAHRYGEFILPATTTTPGPLELQRMLGEMVEAGVSYALMEVTSHALHQYRVHGCRFQGAVFTNLTRDHLDYHRDMDAYLEAKIRLFEEYLLDETEGGWGVINAETQNSELVQRRCKGRVIRFGTASDAEFQARKWSIDRDGTRLAVHFPEGEIELFTPLLGRPNLYNALSACACAWALGIEPAHWKAGLRDVSRIPGRFEPVPNIQGITVIVDYAHTPDALEQVLSSARELAKGRLICIFGCGGDRDRGKRPIMAKTAAQFSDLIIVTSDNPRSEAPGNIIEQIVSGLRALPVRRIQLSREREVTGRASYDVIEDRGDAIRQTIRWAEPGDLVVIAGKGHETFQVIGSKCIPFDDREIAREALAEEEP